MRRAALVEARERVHAPQQLHRQRHLVDLVRWPEAGSEHRDGAVHAEGALAAVEEALEVGLRVLAHVHVREHSLQLRRELGTAAVLELGDETALVVVGGAAVEQQSLRQLLSIELRKHVLVRQVREQHHDLVQDRVDLPLNLVAPGLHDVVAEGGEELGGGGLPDVLVHKHLERLLQHLLEEGVVAKRPLHERKVLVVEVDELLRVVLVILLRLLLAHQRHTDVHDVLAHNLRDRLQSARGRAGQPLEKLVQATEVVCLLLSQQRAATRLLLVHQRRLVVRQKLLLALLEELLFGGGVQVGGYPVHLLCQPLLRLLHVLRTAVRPDPRRALPGVEFAGGSDQLLLELLVVDVEPSRPDVADLLPHTRRE
mmetsp:Transcript_120606/g.180104  ORF Transcript_120606/g.180104 Transcript_120606/m.180104 type:complete len:369 (-) Transcript_120606:675-1781(-)